MAGISVVVVMPSCVEDIELIAVDDLSSDGTREILASLAEKEPRIKAVFNEKNMGVARVRNLALSMASGDFIAFCDSDDIVPKSTMDVAPLKEPPVVMKRALGRNPNVMSLVRPSP